MIAAPTAKYVLSTAWFPSSTKKEASRHFLIDLANEIVEPAIRRG
jgi:hypothetical protein